MFKEINGKNYYIYTVDTKEKMVLVDPFQWLTFEELKNMGVTDKELWEIVCTEFSEYQEEVEGELFDEEIWESYWEGFFFPSPWKSEPLPTIGKPSPYIK